MILMVVPGWLVTTQVLSQTHHGASLHSGGVGVIISAPASRVRTGRGQQQMTEHCVRTKHSGRTLTLTFTMMMSSSGQECGVMEVWCTQFTPGTNTLMESHGLRLMENKVARTIQTKCLCQEQSGNWGLRKITNDSENVKYQIIAGKCWQIFWKIFFQLLVDSKFWQIFFLRCQVLANF